MYSAAVAEAVELSQRARALWSGSAGSRYCRREKEWCLSAVLMCRRLESSQSLSDKTVHLLLTTMMALLEYHRKDLPTVW